MLPANDVLRVADSCPAVYLAHVLVADVKLSDTDSIPKMRYSEIIADNLSKAGWSWGCVSAADANRQTIWPCRPRDFGLRSLYSWRRLLDLAVRADSCGNLCAWTRAVHSLPYAYDTASSREADTVRWIEARERVSILLS
jgi:hypothetical protein